MRPTAYEFGDFRVDVVKRSLLLRADGRPLPISARAFDTLLFFLEHPGELLDKSTLMAAIWPKVVVEENNLNQHISALRRVLGERPEEHRFIVTVPGRGYRFVATVHPVTPCASTPAEAAASPPDEGARASVPPPERPAPTSRRPSGARGTFWAWTLGVTAVAAVGVIWLVMHVPQRQLDRIKPPASPTSVDVVPVRKPRLAVLPFENLSPDPNNAFFADGLHEEIISTIAERVPGVEVISRTTMMSYRANPPKPLALVARELGASHLIEGSVRREGNTVRLTLQLIDAHADDPLWSVSYDRTLEDALKLESQVAADIAGRLTAAIIRPERPEPAAIRDTEAFDLYLKAVLALRTFSQDPAQFRQIEDLLARVIARQPDFARAYAQRARVRTIMFIASFDTSEAFVRQIRADLATAQRLAPKDPLVLAATAYFQMCSNDTSGALETYAAAEAAGLVEPEWLIPKAHMLLRRSRIEELNATLQRMLALDPADPLVILFATFDYEQAGKSVDALRVAAYARDAFPQLYAQWSAYLALDFAGRTSELRSFVDRYGPATDSAAVAGGLLDYYDLLRREHRYEELRALIDRAPATSNYLSGVLFGPIGPTPAALFRGWTDLLLGDRKEARKDGRAVLKFVQHATRTPWNAAHLELLSADGYTFVGDCERARAAAKRGLGLLSRADDAVIWNAAAYGAAHNDAWCGAKDEAIGLLRELTSASPSVPPGYIVSDPLVTVPLAQEPAFRALRDELERRIRDTALEFEPSAASAR